MFVVLFVPAIILFVGTFTVLRSARCLALKERNQEALTVLKRIRATGQEAVIELKKIYETIAKTSESKGF
ncbi:MFS transporter [Acinetobacter sp. ULE_I001]|uniref:MFS transporter n=1 Tax=unclassified Acinetobacter TaxID=196816 RepID=UPI003AF7A139